MRQSGPQRRGRGRPSGRRGFNNSPNRSYDSSGPDIKVRGTASAVYDKYMALGRDAVLSGDRVAAENFFQHAEHYYRLVQSTKQQQQQAGEGEQQRDNRGRGQQSRSGRGNESATPEGDDRKPNGDEGETVEEAKVVPATESLDDDTDTNANAAADKTASAETEAVAYVEEAAVVDGDEQRSTPMNPAELAAMSESGRKARGAGDANGANGRGRGRQRKDNQDNDSPDAAEAAPRRQPRRRRPAQAPEAAEKAAPEAAPEATPEAVVVERETPAAAVASVAEDADSN